MNKADILSQKLVHDFTIDNHELCKDAVLAFCNSPMHIDDEHRYEQNYYGRRLRPHIAKFLDFSSPLRLGRQADYAAFAANRILYAMNESDFLMLPEDAGSFDPIAFTSFYADDKKAAANLGMPLLENYLFSFLDDEIITSDNWTAASVRSYLEEYSIGTAKESSLPSADAIDHAVDPRNAALDFLVQLAPDFLVESSPMARYASGSYGSMASELFKIIIDELGYGSAQKKHAAMFGDMLRSCDLNATPHHYWQYYLNGSLYLANYYNMVTRNKRHFFRYVGAIYQAETAFITSCAVWMETLRRHLPTIDPRYFREHCHIDRDHSRMVLDGIVMPAVEHYGAFAAREVIRGFEEARWLSDYAEADFAAQIAWKGRARPYMATHNAIFPAVRDAHLAGKVPLGGLDEPVGELSITHTHDGDELCHVRSGEMEFINGFGQSTTLMGGQGIIIERNRLHGALIHSDRCEYDIYSVGDVKQWL